MKSNEVKRIINDLGLLISDIDPCTGVEITDNTTLNNEYNKQLLVESRKLIAEYLNFCDINGYFCKYRKAFFYIDESKRKEIPICQKPIPISTFAHTLNDFIDTTIIKKIKASEITRWLMHEGYLEEIKHDDGKVFKILTEKANEIGMLKETKTNSYGRTYDVNLYSPMAQEFIIENLDNIYQFTRN